MGGSLWGLSPSEREQINQHWIELGVTIIDPNNTYILFIF